MKHFTTAALLGALLLSGCMATNPDTLNRKHVMWLRGDGLMLRAGCEKSWSDEVKASKPWHHRKRHHAAKKAAAAKKEDAKTEKDAPKKLPK